MAELIFTRGAEITFEAFSMNDRKRIEKALHYAKSSSLHELLTSKKLKKIPTSNDMKLYLMRATPDIRIVLEFESEHNRVKIVDIVRHDRLEKIYAHEPKLSISS